MKTALTFSRTLLILPAILLAVAGQWALTESQSIPLAVALYAGAVALLLSAPSDAETPVLFAPAQVAPPTRSVWRAAFVILSALCTVLAFTQNTDASFRVNDVIEYQFTFTGVAAWFASVLFFLAAFWQPEKNLAAWREAIRARQARWRDGVSFQIKWTTVALLAAMTLGAFFYFYRLDRTPAEMTSDHAEKLLDVNDILTGHTPLFFIRNTGREPLQFYLTAAIMQLTGLPLSHLALKVGTALIGFLTIPATFLLAREMFDETLGVLAAFFVAALHWPVAIARMGLRYPFTPFFAALSFYFLWRALKYHTRNDFLIGGLMLGAGLYGYIPSRNVPLVALALCALWLIVEGRRIADWRAFARNVGLMLALALVVFAPLLRYSLDFPELFWYRALTRVASVEQPIQGNIAVVFAQNLSNLALAFNWRGDEVWPTNIPYAPTFDMVSGALFVLGISLAVYWLVRHRATTYLYLLAAFAALVLPSALAFAFPRENPSLVRMGGAIPFAAILIALPVAFAWRALTRARVSAALRAFGIALALAPVIALNYQWYFVDYDASYRQSAQNSSEVAATIRDFAGSVGDLQHAYFIGYPFWIDGRAVAIQLGDLQWNNFTLDASDFLVNPDTNLLFIAYPEDKANLKLLQDHYPQGQKRTIHARTPGKDFISFFVPASPK